MGFPSDAWLYSDLYACSMLTHASLADASDRSEETPEVLGRASANLGLFCTRSETLLHGPEVGGRRRLPISGVTKNYKLVPTGKAH